MICENKTRALESAYVLLVVAEESDKGCGKGVCMFVHDVSFLHIIAACNFLNFNIGLFEALKHLGIKQ